MQSRKLISTAAILGLTLGWLLVSLESAEAQKASPASLEWKKTWEKTVQAARHEGRLLLYLNRGPNWDAVFSGFQKEHPEIKPVVVSGSGNQNASRILAERRGEKYLGDIFSGSANTAYNMLYQARALDPIKPALILPEVTDQSRWLGGKHRYADPGASHIFFYQADLGGLIVAYNSQLVDPKAFKSYRDLLNPRWKGKIVSIDPRVSATLAQFLYYHPEIGPDFIRKLFGEMGITFSRDFRQMVDWLARGQFALCMGCRDVKEAKNQGLPVELFDKREWREGVPLSSSGGTLNLLNKAPHPNAARVFINWFLSARGQTVYQEVSSPEEPPNSLRIDIPKNLIPAEVRPVEGKTYLDLTRPEFDRTPVLKLLDETLKSNESRESVDR